MRRAFLLCGLIFLMAAVMLPGPVSAKKIKIGVTAIINHPAIDAAEAGFRKALTDAGYVEGKDVEYQYLNAQGEMANTGTIAQKFANDPSIDLIHSISTPSSQAIVKAVKDKPVVYSAVTDPIGAGLVKTMDPAGGNVTGISDAWPVERQFKLYSEMLPQAKKWGVIYNGGEQNSLASVAKARKAMEKFGLTPVEVTVSTTAEVFTAAQSLIGRVDAVYVTSDSTVASALESVVKVCNTKKIPMFAGDTGSVPRGAIASLGLSYTDIGYAAGKKAVQILKEGKKPGDIPSGYGENLSLVINLKAAKVQGYDMPKKYIDMAAETIK